MNRFITMLSEIRHDVHNVEMKLAVLYGYADAMYPNPSPGGNPSPSKGVPAFWAPINVKPITDNQNEEVTAKTAETEFLNFTQKEISRMPKEFRKYFRYGGKNYRIRQKENGVYEIRFRRCGYNISVSSKLLDVAKKKFIEKLKDIKESIAASSKRIKDTLFKDFSSRWLETVKKPTIKEISFEDDERQLRIHLLPKFGERKIADLHPLELQEFLNIYINAGHMRTALKLYTILKGLLECATTEKIIVDNPMLTVPKPNYEADNGVPLTYSEEKQFVKMLFEKNHPCRYAMIFLLYTGMRRSELNSATTDGVWITIVCAKSRKGKKRIRRLPISPMLRPYMEFFTPENLSFTADRLSRVVPKLLPGHTTHDLRHTFITHTQECGIPQPVVGLWVGHKPDKRNMTASVYTHFSDEFQLAEIEKVKY